MNVRQLISYLEDYDEDSEVQVEVCFGEAGDSFSSTFDVTTFSHEEIEGGERSSYPTIGANIGFGVMSEKDLDLLIDCIKGIDQRLSYYRNGA